jgi:hypothetical protein
MFLGKTKNLSLGHFNWVCNHGGVIDDLGRFMGTDFWPNTPQHGVSKIVSPDKVENKANECHYIEHCTVYQKVQNLEKKLL